MTTDTDRTLLDAVDALTKPFVLARYVGTGHDHHWTPVTRPLTSAEITERKAKKRPIPRKVETGEFWCEWCGETVTERPTKVSADRIDRHDDPPLLDQLTAAVQSNIGGAGSSGKLAYTRTPFDVGAFNLYTSIDERLRGWLLDIGGAAGKELTLTQMLRSWYVLRIGGTHTDDHRYTIILDRWRTNILDIIDPPEQIPYMGQPCPLCGETRARNEVAGDVEDTVALWAFLRPEYRDEGSYGMCKACRQVLARDSDPIRLRARMNGTIKSATRMTRTIGEAAEIA